MGRTISHIRLAIGRQVAEKTGIGTQLVFLMELKSAQLRQLCSKRRALTQAESCLPES